MFLRQTVIFLALVEEIWFQEFEIFLTANKNNLRSFHTRTVL